MKQIASGRITQAAARCGEHAPMTAVCCNACRTCVTANAVGLLTAAVAGLGVTARRLIVRRRPATPAG